MKKGLLALMIIPLCFVLYNNTAYRHMHLLSDGSQVEHAHPYKTDGGTEKESHDHSEEEFLLYLLLTDSPALIFSKPLLSEPLILNRKLGAEYELHSKPINDPVNSFQLRAPPAIFS